MACIIKKIIKGRPYYYAAESKRVNGKPPRIVWQKYLGTLDDILARKDGNAEIKEVDIFEAGCTAAMLRILEKIRLVEIIDSIVLKRQQGPSVGQYIALAIINRIVDPCSKLAMPDWYEKSVLFRLWEYPKEAFSSQRFWDNMDLISDCHIDEIQKQVAISVKHAFSLNPEVILYDTTNFFTYIATRNNRNTIARRGKNKAKRNDLRQVGLALLVTRDFQIPLFHSVYQGNLADRGIFAEKAEQMKNKYNDVFGTQTDSTIVFDKGNISDDAMEKIILSRQHFVCAIPKNILSKLFSTPLDQLKEVSGGTKALSCEVEVWCKKLKAVLVYSESYFVARAADLAEGILKCEKKLRQLDQSISKYTPETRKQNRASVNAVKASIKAILSGDHLKEIFIVDVKEQSGQIRLSYSIDHDEIDRIMKHELGRTILLSTRFDWDERQIISAYREQNTIEDVFKHMKNKEYLHWQPQFHWTDQKIKVHGLYCVFALLVASLANKIAREHGAEMSLIQMISELSNIREVALIHSANERPAAKNRYVLSRMSPQQRKLADALEIAQVLGNTKNEP